MTPEERFTKLENLMHFITEEQLELTRRQAELAERQDKQELLIEQDRNGIRDLIAITRTVVDSQKELVQSQKELLESRKELLESQNQLTADVKALRETVREHEGHIEALIDTVDRIIRRDNPAL